MFTLALYNLKGGVGKTAACVNLAWMAAKDSYRTLIWDLDPQGAASYYYRRDNEKGAVKKLISGSRHMDELITTTEYPQLDIIPSDLSARKLDLIVDEQPRAKKVLRDLLKEVNGQYDFVFLDCPPGFSALADAIFTAADVVLMPVIPTTLSVRTYEMVKDYFKKNAWPEKLACFFSMADTRKKMHVDVIRELHTSKRFFDAYIPMLSDVEKMGAHVAPVAAFAPASFAAVCYRALWEEIKEGVVE